jgi:hypothetical protein
LPAKDTRGGRAAVIALAFEMKSDYARNTGRAPERSSRCRPELLGTPFEAIAMLIFTFASSKVPGLFAFAADKSGRQLPDRHGPWKLTGRVNPNATLPHNLDRAKVEEALGDSGFQMWRRRKES